MYRCTVLQSAKCVELSGSNEAKGIYDTEPWQSVNKLPWKFALETMKNLFLWVVLVTTA